MTVSVLRSADPAWASINKGILICDECCGVHRTLGRHISYVKPLRKGTWVPSQLTMVFLRHLPGSAEADPPLDFLDHNVFRSARCTRCTRTEPTASGSTRCWTRRSGRSRRRAALEVAAAAAASAAEVGGNRRPRSPSNRSSRTLSAPNISCSASSTVTAKATLPGRRNKKKIKGEHLGEETVLSGVSMSQRNIGSCWSTRLKLENEKRAKNNRQLHASVRTANLETSLRLLSCGADANYLHPEKGTRPLHVAAGAGQASQVELLLVYGADPGRVDANLKTPADHARYLFFLPIQVADRLG